MMDSFEELSQHFGKIASLIGERSRAVMLWNLLDGRAYTAGELALCADISKQACSNHLMQLVDANILTVAKQGRHRYFTFADDRAAQVIENIACLMRSPVAMNHLEKHVQSGIKYARTCYDHLAGKVGVEVLSGLMAGGIIVPGNDEYTVSKKGARWFQDLGVNVEDVLKSKRKFAYPCLDWSERKHHLGGALGAAVLDVFLSNDWVRKVAHSREVMVTPLGRSELERRIRIRLSSPVR